MRAVAYFRYSSTGQTEDSIERQRENAERWCLQNNVQLVDHVADRAVSAFKTELSDREGLQQALTKIRNLDGTPDEKYLLVEDFDRLSRRDIDETYILLTEIKQHCNLVSVRTGDIYTKNTSIADFIVSGLQIARSHEESKRKSNLIRSGMQRVFESSLKGGKKLGTKYPAWISLNDDKTEWIVDEHKADVVREIYQLYIDGIGAHTISNILNDRNEEPWVRKQLNSRIRQWRPDFIKRLLKSKAPRGILVRHNGDEHNDYFPRIIEDELWFTAQSRKKRQPKGGDSSKSVSNLFRASCANCGESIHYIRSSSSKDNYLACSNRKKCGGKWVEYTKVENAVLNYVRELDTSSLINPTHKPSQKLENQITAITERNAEIEQQSDELLDNVSGNLVKRKIEKLEAEYNENAITLDELQQQLDQARLEEATSTGMELQALVSQTDQLDNIEFRAKLKTLINDQLEIIISGGSGIVWAFGKKTRPTPPSIRIKIKSTGDQRIIFPYQVDDTIGNYLLSELEDAEQD